MEQKTPKEQYYQKCPRKYHLEVLLTQFGMTSNKG